MSLFGVGAAEAGLILVIAMVLIGPQRFPEIMRQAGRWYRVARRFTDEVMKDVRSAVQEIEREVEEEAQDLRSVRELADVSGDLKAAREETEAVGRSAAAAAQEPAAPRTPTPISAGKPAETPKPAEPGPEYYEGRDPSTYDPFKALEARQRANTSRGDGTAGS
jgi:sec-independent protein translocase protein TatB